MAEPAEWLGGDAAFWRHLAGVPEREFAAARLGSGEVARLSSASTDAESLDTRGGLVDPVIDGFGIVWSVPREEPAALRAFLPGGDVREVADPGGNPLVRSGEHVLTALSRR